MSRINLAVDAAYLPEVFDERQQLGGRPLSGVLAQKANSGFLKRDWNAGEYVVDLILQLETV